jgi:hypothetical protein
MKTSGQTLIASLDDLMSVWAMPKGIGQNADGTRK